MSPADQDFLFFVAGAGSLLLIFAAGVIGLRWLWRRSGGAVDRQELATMRTRLEELEAERGRVAELEERLDFAERLLARQAEIDKLAEGH
ncbi:MAG TPA: hypothetical protein VG940_08475 [Gemmatimonadales bacterium]|nr:hypothetical protein [Gemmatimonadales bacterium]